MYCRRPSLPGLPGSQAELGALRAAQMQLLPQREREHQRERRTATKLGRCTIPPSSPSLLLALEPRTCRPTKPTSCSGR